MKLALDGDVREFLLYLLLYVQGGHLHLDVAPCHVRKISPQVLAIALLVDLQLERLELSQSLPDPGLVSARDEQLQKGRQKDKLVCEEVQHGLDAVLWKFV